MVELITSTEQKTSVIVAINNVLRLILSADNRENNIYCENLYIYIYIYIYLYDLLQFIYNIPNVPTNKYFSECLCFVSC